MGQMTGIISGKILSAALQAAPERSRYQARTVAIGPMAMNRNILTDVAKKFRTSTVKLSLNGKARFEWATLPNGRATVPDSHGMDPSGFIEINSWDAKDEPALPIVLNDGVFELDPAATKTIAAKPTPRSKEDRTAVRALKKYRDARSLLLVEADRYRAAKLNLSDVNWPYVRETLMPELVWKKASLLEYAEKVERALSEDRLPLERPDWFPEGRTDWRYLRDKFNRLAGAGTKGGGWSARDAAKSAHEDAERNLRRVASNHAEEKFGLCAGLIVNGRRGQEKEEDGEAETPAAWYCYGCFADEWNSDTRRTYDPYTEDPATGEKPFTLEPARVCCRLHIIEDWQATVETWECERASRLTEVRLLRRHAITAAQIRKQADTRRKEKEARRGR